MSFIDHFNDISYHINESKTGIYNSINVYGYDSYGYVNGELGPINFWSSDRINEDLEDRSFCIGRDNPLVIKSSEYQIDDLYFATKCVGYAVEHGYDSVIIETDNTKFVITIDFDDSSDYLLEAKPLKGKRLSKDIKQELSRQKKLRDNPTANKPKPGTVKRPKKAPPQGIKIDVLLANTGKLSPDRVERAMKGMQKQPPKLTGVTEIQGMKYFRAEYNFKSSGSDKRQMGYADISQNKEYCKELFCSCSDWFYRCYSVYVAAGLSTWNVPPKFKAKQKNSVVRAPHNHHWTVNTNPAGKLFLCKHLWAFLAYYVTGSVGNVELSDEEIDDIINQYFADVDGDGDEERIETDFEKAIGKLYMGQKGKDIEKPLSDVKISPERRKELLKNKSTNNTIGNNNLISEPEPKSIDNEE